MVPLVYTSPLPQLAKSYLVFTFLFHQTLIHLLFHPTNSIHTYSSHYDFIIFSVNLRRRGKKERKKKIKRKKKEKEKLRGGGLPIVWGTRTHTHKLVLYVLAYTPTPRIIMRALLPAFHRYIGYSMSMT